MRQPPATQWFDIYKPFRDYKRQHRARQIQHTYIAMQQAGQLASPSPSSAMALLDLGDVYEDFFQIVERHEAARLETVLPVSRVRAATAAAEASMTAAAGGITSKRSGGNEKAGPTSGGAGSRIPGRVQIANLVRLLDKLGFTRSATQKEIHKGMVASVLPRIFRFDSDTEIKVAMSQYGLKETSQQFMVLCPRRHGKTIATALFIAAYLLAIPTCMVSVYSTARRASQELLNIIKKMVNTLPMSKSFETINNQETFEISINGDKRRCSSYPGCSRTLRGTGGDLIVLEAPASCPLTTIHPSPYSQRSHSQYLHRKQPTSMRRCLTRW